MNARVQRLREQWLQPAADPSGDPKIDALLGLVARYLAKRDQRPPSSSAASSPPERTDGPLALSVAEAAELLGISRSLAYDLVARGELPSVRLGRRIVVPRVALHQMTDIHTIAGRR